MENKIIKFEECELSQNIKRALKDYGYIIVIATGRVYRSAMEATDNAEFADYIITDNGAVIHEQKTGNAILKKTIDKQVLEKIFSFENDNWRHVYVCGKELMYKYSKEEENNSFIKTIYDKSYILNNCNDIFHIVISSKSDEDISNLYKKLTIELPEMSVINMRESFTDRKWIEIMQKGCSKYNAIKELASRLDIDNDQIIAFGDSLNDIEMISKCGYGVALKNALPNIKESAKAITEYDHNSDGVIKFLKVHLDNNGQLK